MTYDMKYSLHISVHPGNRDPRFQTFIGQVYKALREHWEVTCRAVPACQISTLNLFKSTTNGDI